MVLSPVQFGVVWCGSYFGVTYIGCHSESGVIWVVSLTVPAKLTPALPRTECTPESRMQFSSNLPGMNRTLSALDASFAARSSGIERHCLVALSSVFVLANRLPTSQSPSHRYDSTFREVPTKKVAVVRAIAEILASMYARSVLTAVFVSR